MPPAGGDEREHDAKAADDKDAKTLSPQTPQGAEGFAAPAPTDTPQSERYELGPLLGSGGMGKVYKAFDRKLKRSVALKFLRAADAQLETRFLQEAQAQARVEHAFVCRVYEVGRIGELPYIAMQFIDGQTLREAAKTMTVAGKVAVLRDVAEAVHAAHGLGLIHRDIKPANILIGKAPGSPPFICDFGLARDLAQPGTTQQGALLGTPQYMAPEQARGEHDQIDARTDVYGLGATLYEALTGRPPFEGKSNLQTLYKMMHEEPAPPRQLAPSLPVDLESVVLKCLEKEPARRYPTARALAEDLQRTLDGEPVQARRVSPPARALRWVQRNKALSAALLALLLVGLAPFALPLLERGGHVIVAVADFDNLTGERDLDGLSGMLITSLEQSQRLTVLTRSRMFDLLQQLGKPDGTRIDEALGREVAQSAGAQALVLSTVRKFDALYVVELRVLDPRTGETVVALKEQGTGKASVPRLIDQLSSRARRSLKEPGALAAAPVADVTTRDLQAYEHYFKGDALIDRLHFTAAVEEYRAALAIDPSFALASYRLAYSLMWLHDAARAREAIDRALSQPLRLPEKERLMARGVSASLYSHGREAYAAYLECANRFPSEKECVFMVGDVIFHGGYFAPAIDFFHKALKLDPTMERAWQHLLWADQLLAKDELPLDARQYVARTGTPEAYGQLGRALAARGQLQEAAATLETARTLFPHSPVPAESAGALAAFRFDIDAAVRELKPLAADPSLSPHQRAGAGITLGGALTQGGRIREAIQAYGDAARDARSGGDGELEAVAIAQEALNRFLYLRDAAGARKLMADAFARGVPETWFGFVYPLLGDLDKYASVLKSSGDPLVEASVAAFTARVKGDDLAAAVGLEALAGKSPYQDFLSYVLSDCYAQAHDDARAILTLKRAQALFPSVIAPGPGFASALRARSDHELGRLYERTQQPGLALEATQRFLRAWDKADKDLPELKEARARAERLSPTGKIELR
jgi:tetratricopeptide (TPR) repeat protein/predicted Ser/Thr protein kinase